MLMFLFGTLYAQNMKALATTDSLQYNIGDYIDYSIVVFAPGKYKVELPSVKDSLKSLLLLRKGKTDIVKSKNGFTTTTFNFVLAGYDSLKETIPSMTVALIDTLNKSKITLKTNQVNVVVNTLNVNPKKDIKDIKPVLKIPYDWEKLLLIILAGLVLLALLYFVYKKYFKKEKVEVKKIRKIILPAHKIAYGKLKEIESDKLWQSGKIKEFHSRVTEVVREYFENRFGFNSLEMTTDETLRELKDAGVSNDVLDMTRKFLQNADMVKFAKFKPMPSLNEEMLHEAYKIVDLTKEDAETEITEEVEDVQRS